MASQIPFNWTANAPALTQVAGPPVLVYPDANIYAVYGYFVAVLVLIFIVLLVKIALNRKRYQARSAAALRQTRARQNQLSTVSRSVDANIANSNDRTSSCRRGSDETLKIDLPPTYEEVMRKEATAAATPSTVSIAAQTIDTHEIVQIEIETISTHHRRDLH